MQFSFFPEVIKQCFPSTQFVTSINELKMQLICRILKTFDFCSLSLFKDIFRMLFTNV